MKAGVYRGREDVMVGGSEKGKNPVVMNRFKKAAAVFYVALLSITPLLPIAVSLAGLLLGREAAEGRLFENLSGMMGEQEAG